MSDEKDSADKTETTVVHAMTPSEALNPSDKQNQPVDDDTADDNPVEQQPDTGDHQPEQSGDSEQAHVPAGNADDAQDNDAQDDQADQGAAHPLDEPTAEPDTKSMSSAIDASHSEFTTAFDIIGEMGDTLEDAKSVFLNPSLVKIDRETFQEYLHNLKKMLPVQLERASALMRQAEKQLSKAHESSDAIVRQAQDRASKIIAEARQRADYLSGHEHVTDMARQKADDIIRDAEQRAAKISDGSDQYSQSMLTSLSDQLTKLSRDVQGGLQVLDQRREQARTQLENQHHAALAGHDRLYDPQQRENQA